MTNEIATISTDLTFTRHGKMKVDGSAGKSTTRGVIGLMTSGNKSERNGCADGMVQVCFDNGTFKPVLREFARVFAGKGFDGIVSVLAIDVDKPNKMGMVALLDALVRGTEGKTLKGEKATYRGYAVDLVARADAAQAVREAALALGVAPDVIAA